MKLYGWIGLLLLLISEYCLFRKINPFYSWFYCFAWWSYILLADNLLLKLRGRSVLMSQRRELLFMLPLSVFIWLIFEAYNFRIDNWHYGGIPPQIWIRWPGYAFSFATVLPGIFVTSDLVDYFLGSRIQPAASESEALSLPPDSKPSLAFQMLGLFLCLAPLVWPRYFFPAIWLGPIFLLDPFLERLGIRSLALDLAAHKRRRIWSLLLGGLICGILWEFWNYWAASKWIYTIPYFGHWRWFEMPLLGFLGFPPFALECWIMYHLLRTMVKRLESAPMRWAFWAVLGFLGIMVFYGIDHTSALP
jgi:hypothetical protein